MLTEEDSLRISRQALAVEGGGDATGDEGSVAAMAAALSVAAAIVGDTAAAGAAAATAATAGTAPAGGVAAGSASPESRALRFGTAWFGL